MFTTAEEVFYDNLEGMVADCHAWCVDKSGNVYDYADETIIKQCGEKPYVTKTVIRTAYPKHLQEDIEPYIMNIIKWKRNVAKARHYKMWMENLGHCFLRADIVREEQMKRGSVRYKESYPIFMSVY